MSAVAHPPIFGRSIEHVMLENATTNMRSEALRCSSTKSPSSARLQGAVEVDPFWGRK
jgi:hypothetical protein